MAQDFGEKTEAPTPRRRNEARARGQVPRSHDLVAVVLLLAGLIAARWQGPRLLRRLLALMESALESDSPASLDAALLLGVASARSAFFMVLPALIMLALLGALAVFLQVGPLITFHPLSPTLGKVNPIQGIQRLFSARSFVVGLMNLGKLTIAAAVTGIFVAASIAPVIYATTLEHTDVFGLAGYLVYRLGLWLAIPFLVLALLDYAWQRYRHERDLRMTKEEVKDELRSMEGDPAVKRRRRQLQLQMALHRLKRDVPRADVVVTNPTHFAVALRYESATMPAPQVIAKGADYLALRIRAIAAESGVPIVERKSLARALYDVVDVGQYVPERFYRAVAEILAYVYELSGRWASGRPTESVGV